MESNVSRTLAPVGRAPRVATTAAPRRAAASARAVAIALLLAAWGLVGGATGDGCDVFPVAPAAPTEPAPGLVAHWPLDEGAGDRVADVSPTGLDGTVLSAGWTSGPLGGALEFGGEGLVRAGDEGAVPTAIRGLDQGTIALWLRVDDVRNGDDVPFSLPLLHLGPPEEAAGEYSVTIYVGHGTLADPDGRQVYFTALVGEGPPRLCFDTTESLVLGQWYHYAVAVAPGVHRAWLDGREVPLHYNAETTPADHAFFASVPETPRDILALGYGGLIGVPFGHFHGAIDDVRIYDRVLTTAEVAALVAP